MFFAGRAGEVLGSYFARRLAIVVVVLLLFLLGVVIGAVSVRTMGQSQVDEVADYLATFFQGFRSQGIQRSVVFRDSVLATSKTLLVILLAGLSAYGSIAIPLVVFFRGFVVGFTVGFLVYEMAIRGLFFALVAVLPQNLLLVPAILLASVVCFAFGLAQWKNRFRDPDAPYSFWGTVILTLFAWLVALVGSAVEAYLTPLLVGLFSGRLF